MTRRSRVIMRHKHPDIHQTDTNSHDSFDQLCALASSGALTASEWNRLADHVKTCSQCREELAKYQEIGTFGLSLIAPMDPSLDVESEWSPESAVAKLMRTIQEQEESDAVPAARPMMVPTGTSRRWLPTISPSPLNTSLPYAAVVVLFVTFSIWLYVSGIRIGERRANAHSQSSIHPVANLEILSRERTE